MLEKGAITARLMAKEVYRKKLRWFDLRRADYRLGEKAYSNRISPEPMEFISRLDQLSERITKLSQSDGEQALTFAKKIKRFLKIIARAMQAGVLRLKHRSILRQLGAALRQNPGPSSLSVETDAANAIDGRIRAVNAEIGELTLQTYPWARRPLLLVSLLLLLLTIGVAWSNRDWQQRKTMFTHRSSSLSEDHVRRILAEAAESNEQSRRRQAEAARRETERTQERIAVAERDYREKRDRERAEQERKARVAAVKQQEQERAQQEEARRAQERATAEVRARQEQQKREAERARAQNEREQAAREEQKKKEAAQYTRIEQDRVVTLAQNSPSKPIAGLSPTPTVKPANEATVPEVDGAFDKLPHDPQLLQKLYDGRFSDIGEDKMDLVAVFKAFEHAQLRIKDKSDLNPTAEQFAQVGRYFSDASAALQAGLTLPIHPNYTKTIAAFEASGGNDGEWGEKTYKNLVRLVLQRTGNQSSSSPANDWRLMKRLIVSVSDPALPKAKQQPTESDRPAVDKQIQELASKGAQVILADYGDPQAKSTFHYVHLAFWYRDVPILRRDLLSVSPAHPLAELGNLAVTEVPQTLGEANRKHVESLATEGKKTEVTPELDNPRYQGWKGFVPGASATYFTNTWKQFGSRKQPWGDGSQKIHTLRSITSEEALVAVGDRVQTEPAKVRDNRTPEEKVPAVEEVVELKGKKFKCSRTSRTWKSSWKDVTITGTTWTSAEVPGGLVRYLEDEADKEGGHYIIDKTLQSYTGGKEGDWSGKPSGSPLFITLYNFSLESGYYPKGGLVQGNDGNLYGTTYQGGGGQGTVFKMTPEGVLTTLHVFQGGDGASPVASLSKGRDGNFYGTTSINGTPRKGSRTTGGGTVFRVTPAGKLTTLHNFGDPPDGREPMAALVEGRDGNFYGTTSDGGEKGNCGTVFKVTPQGALTILHRFLKKNDEGCHPQSALAESSDGNFYGTTYNGGKSAAGGRYVGNGTIFRITPAGEVTTLHDFAEEKGDGEQPRGALVKGDSGEFYGVTERGGSNWTGSIFKITPSGAYSLLHSFAVREGGQQPWAGLTRAKDSNFYGTTLNARGGRGSIFRFTPPDNVTTVYSFQRKSLGERTAPGRLKEMSEWAEREKAAGRDHPDMTDGSVPAGTLFEAADGSLYGTTEKGGIKDLGTIFKIDPKAIADSEKRR